MSNEYTEEQLRIIEAVDRFCDENMTEEKIQMWVRSRGVPLAVTKRFHESDLGEYSLPRGIGGRECSMLGRATLVEQLAYRAGATTPFLSIMISMVLLSSMRTITQQEIADELLSRSGWIGFSQAFSEANAGTSPSAIRSAVTVDGDDIFLDGEKTFVSTGQFMPETLVLACDPIFGGGDGGFSLWLVPIDEPGVSTFPLATVGQEMLAAAKVDFDRVKLDPEWQIQTEGKLDFILKRQYELGRVLICASSLGLARAATDDAIQYASSHMVKGQRMDGIAQIQEKIADMVTSIRAMQSFVYDAARSAEDPSNPAFHLDCAVMKRYVPKSATNVASEAMQVFGGRGYTDEERVSRIWQDCRGNQIAQGADEIMARIISKSVVKNRMAVLG